MIEDKVKTFQRLKQTVDRLKTEADKAEGALEQLMVKLKKEYDCDSLGEAKKILAKLKQQEYQADLKFQAALIKFEKEYKQCLADLD